MRRTLCSVCQEPSRAKMASIYWAWYWPSGDRRSYKQFFDEACIGRWNDAINISAREVRTCVGCGKELGDSDSTDVYGTIYIPGEERLDVLFEYHPACFEQEADQYSLNAVRLRDRLTAGGGGPPAPSPERRWPLWASQGIQPR